MSQPSRAFLVGRHAFPPLQSVSTYTTPSRPLGLYLRIEQAVLQLSLGKLTGLGGGGAGGE
jgi:hypothetical protein